MLSGLIDDLDIVAATGIYDTGLKQHASRIASFEGKLDHVAVSIQKFMTLLKIHKPQAWRKSDKNSRSCSVSGIL